LTVADVGPSAGHGGPPNPFSWQFKAPLYLGSALNPINSTLIAPVLVPIADHLHVSVGRTSVLISALYLAGAIAQPTAGKLAEEFGPRRVFQVGIVLVLIGGILAGVSQDLATLTVCRVIIGAGTSAGYPSAMILVRRRATQAGMAAPPGNVLGGLAIAALATSALGPPIGGLLASGFGWRAAFFINVPFAFAAFAMAYFWIPRDLPAQSARSLRQVASRIDVTGIVGFGGAMTALLVFLLSLPHPDWTALVVAGVVAGGLFWWELRATAPFLDVRQLASNLALTRTYLRATATLLVVYTVFYAVTQWVEAGHGYSAQTAGLLLLPMGVFSAFLSQWVSSRNLIRGPLIAAAVSMMAGCIATLFLTTASPAIAIIGVTLVFGVTLGTTTAGNQTALYTQAPPEHLGTASGLYRTFIYLGSIASSVIIAITFHASVTDHGLHTIAYILAGVGVAVLALTVLDRNLPSRPSPPSPDPALPSPNPEPSRRQREPLPDTIPAIDPQHSALVVMNYQPAALDSLTDADALLDRLSDAIALARGAHVQLAYVRVAFDNADYGTIPATNKTFGRLAATGQFLHHKAPETAVHHRVAPESDDIIVRKTRVGAFSTTDLDEQLRRRGIDTVVLAGVSTSGVVLSTVRDAADRDYRVYVLADGSADYDCDVHDVLTQKVFPSQAHVINVGDLSSLLPDAPVS
jgi:MFS family permease/nicotinamidase-related amidase